MEYPFQVEGVENNGELSNQEMQELAFGLTSAIDLLADSLEDLPVRFELKQELLFRFESVRQRWEELKSSAHLKG